MCYCSNFCFYGFIFITVIVDNPCTLLSIRHLHTCVCKCVCDVSVNYSLSQLLLMDFGFSCFFNCTSISYKKPPLIRAICHHQLRMIQAVFDLGIEFNLTSIVIFGIASVNLKDNNNNIQSQTN